LNFEEAESFDAESKTENSQKSKELGSSEVRKTFKKPGTKKKNVFKKILKSKSKDKIIRLDGGNMPDQEPMIIELINIPFNKEATVKILIQMRKGKRPRNVTGYVGIFSVPEKR